jgi:endonuclease/exonuclease/phosphatase family metal-dependent hydrolase
LIRQLALGTAVLASLTVATASSVLAQTQDPIVLNSCAAIPVVGWTNPNDCGLPLSTPDAGSSSLDQPRAAPVQYFEHTFMAPAGAYHVWIRMRALNDNKYNDAVWVQFSDAVTATNAPLYRIGTTSGLLVNLATTAVASSVRGWGWQDKAYWLSQMSVIRYEAAGTHTIRVQTREDGVSVDQIVLSRALYMTTPPGPVTNDTTRLASPTPPANTPPTVSPLAQQTIAEDTSTAALNFAVADVQTPASSLTIAGDSANTALVPNANIAFGGSGTNRTVTVTPLPNQSGAAPITITVSDGTSSTSMSFTVIVTPVNDPPVMSAVANQTIDQSASTVALVFMVEDVETAADGLTVSGASSNTTLMPNANIVLGGAGANRTVTASPVFMQSGQATITLTVNDGTNSVSSSFLLTVGEMNAMNDPPTITAIGDQIVDANRSTAALAYVIGDAETAPESLTVTSSSSNTTLVPIANIVSGGIGANRTVIATPAADQSGSATMTITVSDGAASTSTSFTLTVRPATPVHNTILGRLRVLNWNVKQGYNLINTRNDYNLQIDLIASHHPDIVTLQEVTLADADMPTILINGLTSRTGRQWRGYYQRGNTETDQASNQGIMTLTWLPVDEAAQTLLFDDPAFPLKAVGIKVTVNGIPIYISNTHMYAWDAAVRARQLPGFQSWLSVQGAHRIVAGDFNAFPGETTTWTGAWTTEYTDAWTTATGWVQPTNDGGYTFDRRTATQRPERIDYQWTKEMIVTEMYVVKTQRSDHHVVVTDYQP